VRGITGTVLIATAAAAVGECAAKADGLQGEKEKQSLLLSLCTALREVVPN
jgi:hypothetical protein